MKIFYLVRFIFSHRHLLAEHLGNYAALISEQATRMVTSVRNRVILGIICLCFALISVILGGVGLMLWAVIPQSELQAPWILIVTPSIPAIVAACCGWMACRKSVDMVSELKRQFNEDVKIFQQIGST